MKFRNGMWVRHGDRIGILVRFGPGGNRVIVNGKSQRVKPELPDWELFLAAADGEVHYVDKSGDTEAIIVVALAELQQAKAKEIPKDRVRHMTLAQLAHKGYV